MLLSSPRAAAVHLLLLTSSAGLPRRAAAAAAPALSTAGQCAAPSSWAPRRPFTAARAVSGRSSRTMASSAAAAGVLQIERVPCLSDNYAWLLHEPSAGVTAVVGIGRFGGKPVPCDALLVVWLEVDPAEVAPVMAALRDKGWKLTHILNTHHHSDHVGGNLALKTQFGATVVGPAADAGRIPGIDVQLKDGDRYQLGAAEFVCYDTPGHTRGHVTYFFPASKALFPGDTLFSLGCGRLFEGTPAQMWSSLSKFEVLPEDTRVFCAHEYTQSNARFAMHVDGGNADLQRMAADIDAKRAAGQPTVPSLLGDERKCNPFLRPSSPAIREKLGVVPGASDAEAFGAIRSAKDSFR